MPKNPQTQNYEVPPDSSSLIRELDEMYPAFMPVIEELETESDRLRLANMMGRRQVVQFLITRSKPKGS